MKRIVVLVMVVFATATAVAASFDIDRLNKETADAVAAAERQFEAAKRKAADDYGANLGKALEFLKRDGDLNGYDIVNAEKTRFISEGTVSNKVSGASNVYLVRAMELYSDAVAKANEEYVKRVVEAYSKQVVGLKELVKRFMQADRIEDARVAKEALGTAEFLLADTTVKMRVATETWISSNATYTVSSVHYIFQPLPSLLTCEGNLHGNEMAFHTQIDSANPNIVIDLGKQKVITQVVIRGRPKSAARQKNLAMWLSAANLFDLKAPAWRADRAQDDWTVVLSRPVRARYIRMGIVGTGTFHLKHVRVYGREE